jgi:hypothetical protein
MEMERNERVESGEKLFVIGMALSFVTEVAYAVASVLEATWGGFFLGLIGAVFILYLANWLYTGSNTALKWMLGWAGLQVLLAIIAWAIVAATPGRTNAATLLGYGISWVPFGRLAAYAILGAILLSPSIRVFLFFKAGAEITAVVKEKAELAPSGTPLPLTAEQTQVVAGLANLLGWASLVLIVVGVLRAYFGWNLMTGDWIKGVPPLLEGIVMLLVGILLIGPAGAFDFLKTKGTDTTYLMKALEQLKSLYQRQLLLTALVLVGVLVALIPRLGAMITAWFS